MRFSEANWQKDFITYIERLQQYNQFSHLKFICWTCTPELGAMDGRQMERAKDMGFKVGITDLQFWWITRDGIKDFGFLELKRPELRGLDGKVFQPKGRMSPGQLKFQAECALGEARHGVAYRMDEALDILKSWAIIAKQ